MSGLTDQLLQTTVIEKAQIYMSCYLYEIDYQVGRQVLLEKRSSGAEAIKIIPNKRNEQANKWKETLKIFGIEIQSNNYNLGTG
jgi:hypothetical protein